MRPSGATVAALLAVDPEGLGGVVLRGADAAAADLWTRALLALLPDGAPLRRVPNAIGADRLLGGLDAAATLAAGRVVVERGVLAAADGGVLLLHAARTRPATWPHVTAAIDARAVDLQRDGVGVRHDASFAVVAVEASDDVPVPPAVADRLALAVDLDDVGDDGGDAHEYAPADVAAARERLPRVRTGHAIDALVRGADLLGVRTARTLLHALAAARASAALAGREVIGDDDVAIASCLVLAPRATELPPPAPDEAGESAPGDDDAPAPDASGADADGARPDAAPADASDAADESDDAGGPVAELRDRVIDAARAALPAGLLTAALVARARAAGAAGRAGADRTASPRGRQIGVRRGDPRSGARLDLVATLRAAAPLQRVRRGAPTGERPRIALRREDFRVRTCVTHAMTTTVFVVDASGSSALHRLAEAKGAVELLLAESYTRRERVAVIAFRGTGAELVLPPTSALARARRAVAGLPAGGGTPLATALDLTTDVVAAARRDGSDVVVVLLTDARANVARDGRGGRPRAEADALDAARRLGASGAAIVLLDTSPRPEPFARRVAESIGARYVPLPAGGARDVATAARGARG